MDATLNARAGRSATTHGRVPREARVSAAAAVRGPGSGTETRSMPVHRTVPRGRNAHECSASISHDPSKPTPPHGPYSMRFGHASRSGRTVMHGVYEARVSANVHGGNIAETRGPYARR